MTREDLSCLASENSQWILFENIQLNVLGILFLEKHKWYEFRKKKDKKIFKQEIYKIKPVHIQIKYFVREM